MKLSPERVDELQVAAATAFMEDDSDPEDLALAIADATFIDGFTAGELEIAVVEVDETLYVFTTIGSTYKRVEVLYP